MNHVIIFDLFLRPLHSFTLSADGILNVIENNVNMKVRMSCDFILPEHYRMVSLFFQTEPDT